MKQIAVLGSTGSIGRNSLEIIRNFPERFKLAAISANRNIGLLKRQIKEFRPVSVCVGDLAAARGLKREAVLRGCKLFFGESGIAEMVQDSRIDQVMMAISGSSALKPLLAAIDAGKDIALANKEALVMAGSILIKRASRKNARIIPVDSEQSAIWQCLRGEGTGRLKSIYLTASGGPLRLIPKKDFKDISVSRVIDHPRWKMGKKISVDSATLMNKGLEVLEAIFLFGVPAEKIKVIVHPEAIIHSMVEFIDGVIIAQLSATDMRIPIQYAFSYPQRLPTKIKSVDFFSLEEFNFFKPDLNKFPCLRLAYQAAGELGTAPCVLNAANEACVEAFLRRRLKFIAIPGVIERVLNRHKNIRNPGVEEILASDRWAKEKAHEIIANLN